MNSQLNKTICSTSWTDLNIDFSKRRIKHCCKSKWENFPEILDESFFNESEKIQQRREELLAGIESQDCSKCWESYEKTGTAYRDIKNTWLSPDDVRKEITYFEVMMDNICDMSCIYCSSDYSSRIAKERKHGGVFKNPQVEELKIFSNWIAKTISTQKSHTTISFLGGEITKSNNFYFFVDNLCKQLDGQNASLTLSFLTNGNTNRIQMSKFLNLLESLPQEWGVNVALSNESRGEVAEMVRWGLSWETFLTNLKLYCNVKRMNSIVLAPTPCIFTLHDLSGFLKEAFEIIKQSGKKVSVPGNLVQDRVLDISYYPEQGKFFVTSAEQIVKEYQSIFTSELEYLRTLNWLKLLSKRIGTESISRDRVQKFLEERATEKGNASIKKLGLQYFKLIDQLST